MTRLTAEKYVLYSEPRIGGLKGQIVNFDERIR